MRLSLAIVSACAVGLVLAACSETKVQSLLGSGKDGAPDESQVRVNQALSMPPDLQLRAPSGQISEDGQANKVASAPPPQQPSYDQASAAPDDQASAAPEPLEQTGTAAPAQPAPKQDVYEHYGISKVKPDGTPKSERELLRELREAQIAAKRKQNPNYGTVWNIGNIFKDE
jgi:hypothetical protein